MIQGLMNIVDSISDTGANIFHSIARGIKHVTDDTVEVATEVTDDITNFF